MSTLCDPSIIDRLRLLRAPFAPNQISKLPKPMGKNSTPGRCPECGGWHGLPAIHLDYVGHAALTHRLLEVDPLWSWEPLSLDENGLPKLDREGNLWIKLTVCGITRLGVGDAGDKNGGNATKEKIGDALRNAAMRFGCALDLWHKGESLYEQPEAEPATPAPLSESDLDDIALSMKSATTLDDLQAIFKDAWVRGNEEQHIVLKRDYDSCKVALTGTAAPLPAPASAKKTSRARAAAH